MDDIRYEALKLENQLCFPLYACSKEIIKKYKPHLDKLDLTYTQYLVMMILWDKKELNTKSIGEKLYLDSGTLTPLLKKLEAKGYITRCRSKEDERNLMITITEKGMNLREEAINIPEFTRKCFDISNNSAFELYKLLYTILDGLK